MQSLMQHTSVTEHGLETPCTSYCIRNGQSNMYPKPRHVSAISSLVASSDYDARSLVEVTPSLRRMRNLGL
jgi:hypothetical protein